MKNEKEKYEPTPDVQLYTPPSYPDLKLEPKGEWMPDDSGCAGLIATLIPILLFAILCLIYIL